MLLPILAAAATPAVTAAQQQPVQVMVLGSYHFGNPGRDKVNAHVDDVTTQQRQRELEALADAIAEFKPTRVMVEAQRPGPTYDVTDFARFSPKML